MTVEKEKGEKTLQEVIDIALNEAEQALKDPFVFKRPIKNAAVIGAGPSGLSSARHLRDAGINVRVFERNPEVGGIWCYSETPPLKVKMPTSRIEHEIEPEAYSAPFEGRDKKTVEMTPEIQKLLLKKCPPSACYRDLHNNTPVYLFAFPDFKFPEDAEKWSPFQVTRDYFKSYAEHYDLLPLIEFNTSVDLVTKNKQDDTWELSLSKYDVYPSGLVRISRWKESFDSLVCAAGLHQEPLVPDFKDLIAFDKMWPEKISHSQQYRRPEDFLDKDVLVVGGSISAIDLVRALEGFAKSITISIDGPLESQIFIINLVRSMIPKSVTIKSNIESFSNADGKVDGSILFKDGSVIENIDHVLFCTGFGSRFGFMGDLVIKKDEEQLKKEKGVYPKPSYIDVPESHIVASTKFPLNVYHEVFLMSDPTLAFIGFVPYFSTPSHHDTHARTMARVWSGNAVLPRKGLMNKLASEFDLNLCPRTLYIADRLRREPFITWANHHASVLNPTLTKLENYAEGYEEDALSNIQLWTKVNGEIFEKTRESIKKRLNLK